MRFLLSLFYKTLLLLVYGVLIGLLCVVIWLFFDTTAAMTDRIVHPKDIGMFITGVLTILPVLGNIALGMTTVYLIRRVRIGYSNENGEGKKYFLPLLFLLTVPLFAAVAIVPWLFVARLSTPAALTLIGIDVLYVLIFFRK